MKSHHLTYQTKADFFPQDKKFWIYHVSALTLLVFIELGLTLSIGDDFDREHFKTDLIVFAIWCVLFTLCALSIRWRYRTQGWAELAIPTLIFKTLAFTTVLAALEMSLNSITTLPFYWDTLYANELEKRPEMTEALLLARIIFSSWISTTFFLSSWASLYIVITTNRRMRQSEIDNLRLQNSLKEAKLSSLSNQLNPHFLFNSLNNIRFMIHEDAKHADNMITALSEVLRYSLESSQHEKLPLRNELEIIKRYIKIVEIQFEDRLKFSMDIPISLESELIPPMLLQMLVENAVKHGLEQIKEGGKISVTASLINNIIEFVVSNDVAEKQAPIMSSTGIGLKNIEQRLNLLYGASARITTQHINNMFVAKIKLPLSSKTISASIAK